jgi:hypothetical protein
VRLHSNSGRDIIHEVYGVEEWITVADLNEEKRKGISISLLCVFSDFEALIIRCMV